MKHGKNILLLSMILALGFCFSCGKKVISTEARPLLTTREAPKALEAIPAPKPEAKLEMISPEKAKEQEREARLREETLREEALREKALREKAIKEKEERAKKEAAVQEAAARAEAALKKPALESVYFDYDQWNIREDQKQVMLRDAEWLKANPQFKLRIEGNCDERGTTEYNLALGQKRAEAAKAFLEGLGISRNRMETISYGKERPFDPGHDEAAWSKNRRVDFIPIR